MIVAIKSPVRITTVGAVRTTSSSYANVALPVDSTGATAKIIRLAATTACHVKLGTDDTVTATTSDLLVQVGDAIEQLDCHGYTHIAAIRSTADGVLQISPVEVP
jgi:hypothetical protein